MRAKLDRDELRYTWTDTDGNVRASDDGGPRPPKDWWTANSTTIDRERREVCGNAVVVPTFLTMFFVKVYPVTPAVEHPAQEAPRRGRPSSAPLVLEEAERRLQGSDRALHIQRGRDNFLGGAFGLAPRDAPRSPANGSQNDRRPSSRERERPGSSAGSLAPAKIIPLASDWFCSEINFGRKTLYRNRNKRSLLQDRAGHSTQLRKVPNVVATKNG